MLVVDIAYSICSHVMNIFMVSYESTRLLKIDELSGWNTATTIHLKSHLFLCVYMLLWHGSPGKLGQLHHSPMSSLPFTSYCSQRETSTCPLLLFLASVETLIVLRADPFWGAQPVFMFLLCLRVGGSQWPDALYFLVVRPSHSHECDILRKPWWNFSKFGKIIHLDSRWTD